MHRAAKTTVRVKYQVCMESQDHSPAGSAQIVNVTIRIHTTIMCLQLYIILTDIGNCGWGVYTIFLLFAPVFIRTCEHLCLVHSLCVCVCGGGSCCLKLLYQIKWWKPTLHIWHNKPALTNDYFEFYCRIDLLRSRVCGLTIEDRGANYLIIHTSQKVNRQKQAYFCDRWTN